MIGRDDEKIKQEELEKAAEYRQFLKDLEDTFGTEHGGRVLKHLLDAGRQFSSVFTGNSRTYYLSGVQDYVRESLVAHILAGNPEIYFKVMREIIAESKLPDVEIPDSA